MWTRSSPIERATAPAAPSVAARVPLARTVGRALPMLLLAALLAALWLRGGAVAEIPVQPSMEVRQWNVRACGPAALATLLNAYHRTWEPGRLEAQCRVGKAGCSLLDLKRTCAEYGLLGEGLRATTASALTRVRRPYIAYLTKGHFVVVERYRQGRLEVLDPSGGQHWQWSPEELLARGDGWVLSVRESPGTGGMESR